MLFVADRVDGLGGRLGSMIEASWLADRLGGRFVFYWRAEGVSDQMNAIVAKEQVFSAAFLERHHVPRAELARLAIRPLGAVHRDLAGALRPGSGIDGLSVNWQPPLARLLHGMPGLEGIDGDRRASYEAIGLAPGPARARALAQRVALAPGTAALHLRAGDIVYGRYRASDLFHAKVSPYTAVLGILRAKAAQGAPVVVFGQDEGPRRAQRISAKVNSSSCRPCACGRPGSPSGVVGLPAWQRTPSLVAPGLSGRRRAGAVGGNSLGVPGPWPAFGAAFGPKSRALPAPRLVSHMPWEF
jgi:hypothetical protein